MTEATNNKLRRSVLFIALAGVAAWSAWLAINEPASDAEADLAEVAEPAARAQPAAPTTTTIDAAAVARKKPQQAAPRLALARANLFPSRPGSSHRRRLHRPRMCRRLHRRRLRCLSATWGAGRKPARPRITWCAHAAGKRACRPGAGWRMAAGTGDRQPAEFHLSTAEPDAQPAHRRLSCSTPELFV